MFLYVKLFVQQKSYFFGFCKKISVSFVGLLKKLIFSVFGFFCLEKWFLILYISPLFFCFIFWTLFLFFHTSFLKYKKRCSCWKMEQKLSFVFCFCFLGFKNMLCPKKSVLFSTIFDLLFEFFSLSSLKTTENTAKKSSCFVSVPSLFLFHLFSFNIFPYFLSSLFSLFSPFSFLSLFLHLMFPCSFFSPSPFLCIFILFDLTFLLSLLFLISFAYFFFTFFSSSPYMLFWTENIQKFLWSILLDEILSLFFEPSLLRCLVSCFFTFASSSFLVCSMFYS